MESRRTHRSTWLQRVRKGATKPLAFAAFALLSGNSLAQNTIPAVQVTTTRPSTDGGTITCFTGSCQRLFGGLGFIPPMNVNATIGEGYERDEFCEALSDQQPSGCANSSTAAPRVPGVNIRLDDFLVSPGVNGCGTGFVSNILATGAASVAYSEFNGNLDAPIAGLNFRSACDAHDACFAAQRGFVTCNREFFDAMTVEIDRHGLTPQSSIRYWAETFRNAYAAAVATGLGQDAYNAATAAYSCAMWNLEMDANQCPRN